MSTKKILSAVIALALVVSAIAPSTASAQTAAELQAQIAAITAQLAAMNSTTVSAPAYVFTRDLTLGSVGVDVMNLQKVLNMSADTQVALTGAGSPGMETSTFGPATKAAVIKFQNKYAAATLTPAGLTSGTGFVGALTRAKLNSMSAPVTTTTTTTTTTNLPAGCVVGAMFSATTGLSCTTTTTTTTSTTGLTGGAGDLTLSDTSIDVEDTVLEGGSEQVLGIKAEADGSDVAITSVKVEFNDPAGTGSTRISKYVEEVSIVLDGKEVGSADVDEFTKDGTTYSKSISLSNAVVRDNKEAKLYVVVSALSTVDDTDKTWDVEVTQVRFNDATGAILTADVSGLTEISDIGFEDLSSSGDIEVKVSKNSSSPDAQVVEVDSDSDTNDVPFLDFKIKATGSDITVDNLEFDVTPTGANANEIVSTYKLLMDGEEIDSVDAGSIASGNTGTIEFSDLEDEIAISEGDTVEFSVVADVNELDGNFGNGDSLKISFTTSNLDDTTNTIIDDQEGDTVVEGDRVGSAIGETQTFFEDGIMVNLVGTPTAVKSEGDAQASTSDSGTFTIKFEVTAFGSDIYVDKSAPLADGGSGESDLAINGTGTVTSSITSTAKTGDSSDGFFVEEGTTRTFTVTTNILATASGFFDVAIGSIAYNVDDEDADTYYSSDLDEFKTDQIFLYDR